MSLFASGVRGGEPATSAGIDVIVGDAQGSRGETVDVPIRFVAGPDDGAAGGRDEISSLSFSIGFGELQFDPTDVDPLDDIPDAIVFDPESLAELSYFLLIATVEGNRLDLIVIPAAGGAPPPLPFATLMTIQFRIPDQTAAVRVSLPLSSVTAKDINNASQLIDEAVGGAVTVITPVTPTVTASGTPTPSATAPRPTSTPTATQPPPTTRPTRTLGPATATPGVCGPGFDCSITEEEGGCTIAPGGRGDSLLLALPLGLILWRRRPART